MKFSTTGQVKDDLLIQVTARVGLTVFALGICVYMTVYMTQSYSNMCLYDKKLF